jgi:DNA-binding NarL/FixJ family response regulator
MKFTAKWSKDTIVQIINDINLGKPSFEIQYYIQKYYGVYMLTAINWIGIAKRVKDHIDSGLSLDQALEKDKQFRNSKNRKTDRIYHYATPEEIKNIVFLRKKGFKNSEIAKQIGMSKSSITRIINKLPVDNQ